MSSKSVFALSLSLLFAALLGVSRISYSATPAQVENAITKAVDHLYKIQNKNGNWEPTGEQAESLKKHGNNGGYTAIATYALLAAGESPQNPKIKKAVEFLIKEEIKGIYAVGIRCNVYHLLPQTPEVREAMRNDLQYILTALKTDGKAAGLFDYTANNGQRYDHSVSQYGVLGLWACAQSNMEIPDAAWKLMDAAWRDNQEQDGGWRYQFPTDYPKKADAPAGSTTASMTAAGVASLFITRDMVSGHLGVNCTGNIVDKNIEAGLAWMSKRGDSVMKSASLYTLYGVERIGVAAGYKYFGTVDWYEVGAERLVKSQAATGAWNNVPDTCFGILFLVRGRAPVVMNKLEYLVESHGDKPRPASWNERPRDVANFARWMGKQIEKDLNWQIVNLKVDIDDLHDSQILYISGKEGLDFTAEEETKLKRFVEQGGMILGNADCASTAFTTSFQKLGARLFGYEFRELPQTSPIYTNGQYRGEEWRSKPQVSALSNGVRELMVLFPSADPARGWQVAAFAGGDRKVIAEMSANIFLYSVDKQNLRYRGQTYVVKPSKSVTPKQQIKLARLKYAGNWDPEPGGWRRLAAVMHNKFQVDLKIAPVELGSGKLDSSYPVAHLTGTGRFSLNDAARSELRKYVEAGGTLIVDAAGGNGDFATQAEEELGQLFPQLKGQITQLTPSHAVFTAGEKIGEVEYRQFARKVIGNIKTPRLRGGNIGSRTAVFFSPEDLSAGLVGQPVDGIYGYIPSSMKYADGSTRSGATEIMTNLVLHAAKVNATPAPKPAPATPKPAPAKPAEKKPEPKKPAAKK